MILAGEAGMGKTRLATELQKRALKIGSAVMGGGCSEAELTLPYLPFLEAIGNYLRTADLEHVRHQLGPARRELAHLFPQLEPEPVRSDDSESVHAKLRLFEAILALLAIPAGDHGLLLVLEDLHWADASTRELVDYMTRRLRNSGIMVLATYRSDDLHRRHPLLPMVQGWRRAQIATVIDLSALPPPELGSMVRAIFDMDALTDEFRDFLYSRTEGNPFVLEEMLKAAIDRGDLYRTASGWERKALGELKLPQTVKDTILLRVQRLSDDQVEILKSAAVLGPSFAYPTLVSVSRQEPDSVKRAVQAFVLQQLVEEDPRGDGSFRFRHALIREAIYDDCIAPERLELHARAAEVLRQDPHVTAVELANHLFAAKRWHEAVPVAIKAAEEAERLFGYREAASLYERVLPYVDDQVMHGQILCRLGQVHRVTDQRVAQRYLEDGIRLLEEAGQRREAARYRIWLGRLYREQGRSDLAVAECERVRDTLEPEGPSEELATAYVQLAASHNFECRFEEALAVAERAIEIAQAARADLPRIWAYNFKGGALAGLGREAEGLEYLDRSYREALQSGFHFQASNALHNAIDSRIWSMRPREALETAQLLHDLHGRASQSLLTAMAAFREATTRLALGEVRRSREILERARPIVVESNAVLYVGWFGTSLAQAYAAMGEFEKARGFLPQPEQPERQEVVELSIAAIRVELDAGDGEAAVVHARRFVENTPDLRTVERWAAAVAVEAFIRAGRIGDAAELVEKIAALRPDDDPLRAQAEGRLALAQGDLERARQRLVRAAARFAEFGYRLDESRTRRALAEALIQAGERIAAEAEFRKVVAYADESGADYEGRAAREQLSRLGVEIAHELGPQPESEVEAARQTAERLVTVMFVDVRGYTAMAGKTAPADLADRISAFYRWAEQEIDRHHGTGTQHAGDAIMATFNVSGVRLDHAQHALGAAIAIRDKAAYAGLPVGIAIAVGPAIVGQFSAKSAPTALGETVNLAARLQAQAAPGEILLSEETYRRTASWLSDAKLPTERALLTLKGFEQGVPAHRIAGDRRTSA